MAEPTTPGPSPPDRRSAWRVRLHEIIFEADTPFGRAFDVALFACIILSIIAVLLDSVRSVSDRYSEILIAAEWTFTILFTIEYALRLISVRNSLGYARSFFGIVDLLSIVPTYLSLLVTGTQSLLVLRALRLLRVFRVLKLAQFLVEADILVRALKSSRFKITVFLFAVINIVVIMGAAMYLVEGEENGYDSIPRGMYWAIVTMTTVGYGDISPQTAVGQALASMVMIMGYAIIAVPTGIVSVEIMEASRSRRSISTQACPECCAEGHRPNARYCMMCGSVLNP